MATKKKNELLEEMQNPAKKEELQNEINPELNEIPEANASTELQTETNPVLNERQETADSAEFLTEAENLDEMHADLASQEVSQKTQKESVGNEIFSGAETEEKLNKPRRRKKADEKTTQSDTDTNSEKTGPEDAEKTKKKRTRTRLTSNVLSIDDRPSVETDAEKAKNDLLDLLESQKTGRILSGTIQGVERPVDNPSRSLAVIYHGEFKVIIPAEEAVEPPDDYRGRLPEDVLHYMLTKRLGAEVDFIIKGIDPKSGIAAASRLEAMRARRKQYYLGTDRDGNNLLYTGVCAEARIVSVIRAGIFVDLFGLEIYIPLRELSYQRWMDASAYFQPGQRILIKVIDVDRSDRNHIKATASVKQAGENPYEKALRRYSIGNRYVGTVSVVDVNGVFVALDGGIDCLCSYPKRGRPPRGARVTVRILGINHDSNRIWGAITHIAAPR